MIGLAALPALAGQPEDAGTHPVHDLPPEMVDRTPPPSVVDALLDHERYTLRSVTVYWDDDGVYSNIVQDTDRYYSSGQGFEFGFAFDGSDLSDRLAPGWEDPRFGFGLSIKQHIYTSERITDVDPPADDHPYGGWLYLGLAFQRSDRTRHDHLELDLGVVGQWSGAEAVQEFVHNTYPNNDDPQGWGTQLANELAVNLTYERTWRTERGEVGGVEFDMLPALGFDAGNVFLRGRAKVTTRVGLALPDDFGPPSFLGHKDHTAGGFGDPGHDWSLYAYASGGVDAVGRNMFLDGNTFADSRSTDHEPLVTRATLGVVARYKLVEFGWAQTWESKTFKAQPDGQTWGSWVLNIQWRF